MKPLSPAQRRLVEENLKFVYLKTNQFLRRSDRFHHIRGDLEQAALEAMCHAASRFQDRGVPFVTYAARFIDGALVETAYPHRVRSGQKVRHATSPDEAGVEVSEEHFEPVELADLLADVSTIRMKARVAIETRLEAADKARRGPKRSGEGRARVVEVFMARKLEGLSFPQIAKSRGFSEQRAREVYQQAEAAFEAWAEEVRKEAA